MLSIFNYTLFHLRKFSLSYILGLFIYGFGPKLTFTAYGMESEISVFLLCFHHTPIPAQYIRARSMFHGHQRTQLARVLS